MNTCELVKKRILELCREKNLTLYGLSICAAVSNTTLQSILKRNNDTGIVTIKKLCDGFGITLGQFFNTPEFEALEQEIK